MILGWAIKATAIAGVSLLLCLVVTRAQIRVMIQTTALLAIFAASVLAILGFGDLIVFELERAAPSPTVTGYADRVIGNPESGVKTWVISYLIISASLALRNVFLPVFRARRLVRSASPVSSNCIWSKALHSAAFHPHNVPPILASPQVTAPGTIGWLKPCVIVPMTSTVNTSEAGMVLAHELGHIRQHDWIRMQCAHLIASVLWIHPLVWLLRRQLTKDIEQAADEWALDRGCDAESYVMTLAKLKQNAGRGVGLAIAASEHSLVTRARQALDYVPKAPRRRLLESAVLFFSGSVAVTVSFRVVDRPFPSPAAQLIIAPNQVSTDTRKIHGLSRATVPASQATVSLPGETSDSEASASVLPTESRSKSIPQHQPANPKNDTKETARLDPPQRALDSADLMALARSMDLVGKAVETDKSWELQDLSLWPESELLAEQGPGGPSRPKIILAPVRRGQNEPEGIFLGWKTEF